jgi:hypothetical protein
MSLMSKVIASNVFWKTTTEYSDSDQHAEFPNSSSRDLTSNMNSSAKTKNKYKSEPCQIPLAERTVYQFCKKMSSKELSKLESISILSYGILVQQHPIVIANTLPDEKDRYKKPSCHRVLTFIPLKEFLEDNKISDVARQSILQQASSEERFVFCLGDDHQDLNFLLVADKEELWIDSEDELSALAVAHLNDNNIHEAVNTKDYVLTNFRIEKLRDDVKIVKMNFEMYSKYLLKMHEELPELKEIKDGQVIDGRFFRLSAARAYMEEEEEDLAAQPAKQLSSTTPPNAQQQAHSSNVPPLNPHKKEKDKDCIVM